MIIRLYLNDTNTDWYLKNHRKEIIINYKNLKLKELQEWFSEAGFKTLPYWHQLVTIANIFGESLNNPHLIQGIGTGKTLTALYTLYLWNVKGKTLVICPKSVIKTWKDEIEKHTDFTYCVLDGTRNQRWKKLVTEKVDIFIINYEGLRAIGADIKNGKNIINPTYPKNLGFEVIISDESHRYRHSDSIQSRIAFQFSRNARYVIAMTGSPLARSTVDLFGQYMYLDNGKTFGPYKGKFLKQYFYKLNRYSYDWTPKKICHVCGELYTFKQKHLDTHKLSLQVYRKKYPEKETTSEEIILEAIKYNTIRFTRAECLDLPEKIYETREVYPSKQQKETMEEIIAGLDLAVVKHKLEYHTLKLIQVIGGTLIHGDDNVFEFPKNPKLNELENILNEIDGKVIIFFTFIAESIMIERLLKKRKTKCAILHGRIKDKESEIDKFQNDKDCKVLLSHPRSGGEGLNLQIANTIIYYNNGYLGTILREQSEGRIHRQGQTGSCLFLDIIMQNSIDTIIHNSLRKKQNHTQGLMAYLQKKKTS